MTKMELFITFGQSHAHAINGKTFDRNCVGIIKCKDYAHGREIAFECFGDKFATTYGKSPEMHFFPRGFLYVN